MMLMREMASKVSLMANPKVVKKFNRLVSYSVPVEFI